MTGNITTAEYVLWAYRLLLGREPEDVAAVEAWPETDRHEIVKQFLNSPEFAAQQLQQGWMSQTRQLWFIAELANGIRFWVRGDDEYISRPVIGGDYEPLETAFVRRFVKRGMNVVDIGANIGWFTVNMAILVGPAGHVDAFEPRQDLAYYLQRTVTENRLGNVAVHRCALAASDGDGAVLYDSADRNAGGTHLATGEVPAGAVAQPVPVRRLDSVVWGAVHFIKMDVEGAERLVLNGAGLILSRDRPVILTEINDECLRRTSQMSGRDYVGSFAALEYEVRTILPGGHCGERLDSDSPELAAPVLNVACLPAERAADLTAARR